MTEPITETAGTGPPRKREPEGPLAALLTLGQSAWLDQITRAMLKDGELERLIGQGLRGLTSNPTIFHKAITGGHDYDQQIEALLREGKSAREIFEALAVEDIRAACDLFAPTYEATDGRDGMASIEVSPGVARDTEATIAEARRLWRAVGRPNVMVKVPGTAEGLPAIEQLLREGINVNITLLFSRERHEQVMRAYLRALEARAAEGAPLERLASVASFFVSRVDTLIDKLLDARQAGEGSRLGALRGQAATANARLAYARFRELFGGEAFAALAARGARVQRPLWASTSTKDPAYPKLKYVEALIGPDTVDTMTAETLALFLEEGEPRPSLEEGIPEARATLRALEEAQIDLDAATRQLEEEGIRAFAKSYDELLAAIEAKRQAPH